MPEPAAAPLTLAVNEVFFRLFPGDILGFLGPNGAGKTTTLRMLATVLAPDRVRADKQVGTALERAIADLHYGTICINQYSGFVYSLMTTPWGSFPGQEAWDIQSGSGFVNNPFMLRQPQKSVFTAPFQRTDPVTIQNRFAADFCKRYADFQSQPSPSKLIKVFRTAMKG